MNLYQLIYARCDKAFKIDKNGKEKFVIANAGSAGYGWFGVSKQMIEDKMLLNVAADIDNLFLSGFAKDFSDSRSQFVRSSFAYTKVSYEDRIIPIWAYIYIQNIPNSNRSFTGRHFLVGDKSDKDITPCRMINAEAWKDFQKKDSHSNRDDLSVKDTEKIKNSLRGEPTRESSIEDNDYFKNNQKRRELLKKALCFVMEQISLINYENKPEQAKTLIIREAQKDMVFWIEAITYLLALVNGDGKRDYVSKLTFITNVSDIRDNSDKVLFYNKRLPYFIIAGAYPADKTVNFGNDGTRYHFMNLETGGFPYYDSIDSKDSNNPFNPNNEFFKDILENPEQVMEFSQNSNSQSPKDFLLEYDLQAKEKFIAKNINNKKEIDYKYIWDFFSEFDNFYNEKREKQVLGMTDIIDEIIKNRYDLFVEDYEHDFNLSSLICEKFPEKQKDILIRKLKVCLDKYRNLGIQANREPLKILEKILEKILDKFRKLKVCLDKCRNLGIQANREPLKILDNVRKLIKEVSNEFVNYINYVADKQIPKPYLASDNLADDEDIILNLAAEDRKEDLQLFENIKISLSLQKAYLKILISSTNDAHKQIIEFLQDLKKIAQKKPQEQKIYVENFPAQKILEDYVYNCFKEYEAKDKTGKAKDDAVRTVDFLRKFKEIAKKQKRILDLKSEKILSIVRHFANYAEEKKDGELRAAIYVYDKKLLYYTLKDFHKENIKERIKEKTEQLNKDNNDNNAENNTAEYTEKSLTGSHLSEVEEDNGISYDQPISENSVKEKEVFFHNLWQYIKSLFGKKQESKSTRHGKKQTRR